LLLVLSALPYLVVWLAAPEGQVFGGILYNPWDGNSYLAKMRQGWWGDWQFHLPFTEEPHPGALIMTFYLFLGHVARWFDLSLPLAFHLARVAASGFMLAMLWRLLGQVFPDRGARRKAFLVVAVGAGLGWAFLTAEPLFPDLWVPEAFTFYSILSNPHFPLALGLIAWIFTEALANPAVPRDWIGLAVSGLALAVVQPFAIPVAVCALAALVALLRLRGQPWRHAARVGLVAFLPAVPVLLYDWWVYGHNPALAAWSAQNVTASPPAWHWLIAYGLLVPLTAVGVYDAVRRSPSPLDLFVLWLGISAVGMYVPFALQRRFSMGLQVPVAVLAVLGFLRLTERLRDRQRRWGFALTLAIVSLSSVALLAVGIVGGIGGESRLFLRADEVAAMTWLRESSDRHAVVLASPELSTFVPGWSGNPVVCGHPYETIRAEEKQADVERFFAEPDDQARTRFLEEHRVSFLVVGPRESAISADLSPTSLGMRQVFAGGAVTIWVHEGHP
jgi:hypothetical protein